MNILLSLLILSGRLVRATSSGVEEKLSGYVDLQQLRQYQQHQLQQQEDETSGLEEHDECNERCHLRIIRETLVRESFLKYLEDEEINLVHFQVIFPNHSKPALESYPYMKSNYKASRWVWASSRIGRRMLELPFDADLLSLHLLNFKTPRLEISVLESPRRCFVMLTSKCRLVAIRRTIADEIVLKSRSLSDGSLLCHQQFVNGPNSSSLVRRCCSVGQHSSDESECRLIVYDESDFDVMNFVSLSLAVVVTLYSPLLVVGLKQFLVYEKSTKFFRASLKHGITGQCSYVIRISYRQLIDLNDANPFSLPKSFLRLILHCYGEGRCCIHWWGLWPHQPSACLPNSKLRKFWFVFLKILGILLVYPWALHLAFAFYLPRYTSYKNLQEHVNSSPDVLPVKLKMGTLGVSAILSENLQICAWILFSLVSFFYILVVLSWSDNPVERHLLNCSNSVISSKKPANHVKILQKQFSSNYKSILTELAYGSREENVNYFFQLPWRTSKIKRIVRAGLKTLGAFVPIVNVCARLYPRRILKTGAVPEEGDKEGIWKKLLRAIASVFAWLVFGLLLSGYSTMVFLIAEYCFKVIFFVLLACFIYPSTLFPWLCFAVSLVLYANDFLSRINFQHRFILKLIDENSPRLSAIEESELEESSIHLLKSHSLGAVKFIDGDGTEYVSKELYYGVCDDLKYGWSRCLRYFAKRMSILIVYMMIVLVVVKMLNFLWKNEGSYAILITIAGTAIPKTLEMAFRFSGKNEIASKKIRWSKNIPDVLDRHIKVDRMKSARVDGEEFLSTYDVRPVGNVEMELPRFCMFRTLELWKFPWLVSCEQQTQTNEFYVNALANRMAAVSFLSKAVSKNLPGKLDTEASLKSWSMVVEGCILEACSRALTLQFSPFSDSSRLFPPELQPLLFSIDAGNSVDSLVDNINRELYGFYVNAVLANINASSCAILKFGDNKLMAFKGSCHADHFSDFYGAVLVVTDFNAQNLQLLIKFLIDHQHPDSVPVYSYLAAEAFVLRSAEVLDIESVV